MPFYIYILRMPIHFFSEEIIFKIDSPNKFKNWIKLTAEDEGFKIKALNYIFCSDQYLLSINKEFLNHYDYTDIITFDNSEKKGSIEGDIYISIERVKQNAETFGIAFNVELSRIIIHGLLHLTGYTDKLPEEKTLMTSKENSYLLKINIVPRGTI